MTTIYFIRHAEPDLNVQDDFSRPLTPKGQADTALVTAFLSDKNIDVALSSPYKRAVDTIAPFASSASLHIHTIDDFRERKVADEWILSFGEYAQKQWANFEYKLPSGESLSEVQTRNITALEEVLREYNGKNIVVGTHGTSLSTIIHHYDNTYGYNGFEKMARIFPWVCRMDFDDNNCIGMEKIDLFNPIDKPDFDNCVVRTADLGALKAYKYTVIFARYQGFSHKFHQAKIQGFSHKLRSAKIQNKWLYCRAKERNVFETAGGHIEPGETPLEAAKRELYEETGATKFDITPAFDYAVHYPNVYANGQVFLADIHELGDMPAFEMAEVAMFNTIPDKMRFPHILPVLFERVTKGDFNE